MKQISIPKYSLAEEIMNAITHGIGALLGIIALILSIMMALKHNNPYAIISSILYGTSLIILYTISTLYHSFSSSSNVKKVFRVFDHCSIYLLILGTYIPLSLVTLGNKLGFILLATICVCAIIGIILNLIDLEKYKKISLASYIVMGWTAIFAIIPMSKILPKEAIIYLIAGGLCYTVGAIIYVIGKKVKYMHSVWHLFVLAGSILHFICIYLYII